MISNLFHHQPVEAMKPVFVDIDGGRQMAWNLRRDANFAVANAILDLDQKLRAANPDADVSQIKAEIKQLRAFKKTIQAKVNTTEQARELTVRVGKALENVEKLAPEVKDQLAFHAQTLVVECREFEGRMKAATDAMKGIAKDAYGREPAPGNILSRIIAKVLSLFGFNRKPDLNTLSGLKTYARQLQDTIRSNQHTIETFAQKRNKIFDSELTPVVIDQLPKAIEAEKARLEKVRQGDAQGVAVLAQDKAHLEADRAKLQKIYDDLKAGNKDAAVQGLNILGREFGGHIKKIEEQLQVERKKLSRSLFPSSKAAHKAEIAKLEQQLKFFGDAQKLPGKLLEQIEKGQNKAAVQLLNTNIADRSGHIAELEKLLQKDVDNAERIDALTTLEVHFQGTLELMHGPNPADTQAVADWMASVDLHLKGFCEGMKTLNPLAAK